MKTCSQCGSSVVEARVRRDFQGFCPGCLAREVTLGQESRRGDLFSLGRYRAVRLLGRGGMGTVYESVDESTGRRVALKILTTRVFSGARERREDEARFLAEARLCAAVGRHPNLVAVYDAGVTDNRRFIVMELIRGTSLSEWALRPEVSRSDRVAALRDVLRAVHHVHERDIIHRDLKPSNVLVDESGSVRVVDFGIARGTREEASLALTTRADGFAGTPLYMSPQQAMGEIDRRSDIYSAGVILYELLCGRLPFGGHSTVEVLLRAATEAPPAPSQVEGTAADPELDRICLKAMARDAVARYRTAHEFEQDLDRWLRGVARRNGAPRLPARRSARVLALLATAAIFLLGLWLTHPQWNPGALPDGDGREVSGGGEHAVVPATWPNQEARTLLGHRGQVVRVAFSPDGETLASSDSNGTVILWDVASGQLEESLTEHREGWVRALDWSREGDRLATGGHDSTIRLRDSTSGRQLQQFGTLSVGGIACLSFHPAGTRLAFARHGIHILDFDREEIVQKLTGHEQVVLKIAFSPDGRYLASGSLDHTIRLWDLETEQPVWSLTPGCQWAGGSVAFSPDGRFVASEREDKVLALWDTSTGECMRRFEGHESHINAIVFSPGGTWAASASHDTTIRIWCLVTGRCLDTLRGHTDWVRTLDVSRDGLRLASGGTDGSVKIWKIQKEPSSD